MIRVGGSELERRNRRIVARYLAGERRQDIADSYGISTRQVSRIVAQAGATLPPEELVALARERALRPGAASGGRPREIHLVGDDLRQTMGAAFARQAFGIAA